MVIIINATDVHSGGGKVMLNDLLLAAQPMENIYFHVFVDPRYEKIICAANNIKYYNVSKFKRIFVDLRIRLLVESNSVVLNIGTMPSFIKHECTIIQFLMNRYVIDNYPTNDLPVLVSLRLSLQKVAFRYFLSNADYIFVHNQVMKELLLKLNINHDLIKIVPYKNPEIKRIHLNKKKKDSFIYVASDEPHKNHKNLIKAWCLLFEDGLEPTLYLTIDDSTDLYYYIVNQIKLHCIKIKVKPKLDRAELLQYYHTVNALIYPSYFECFGIPIVEAREANLPVIASELDYVRDILDPVETFDPSSPRSIARAVKRFLKINEKRHEVVTAKSFFDTLITYAKK